MNIKLLPINVNTYERYVVLDFRGEEVDRFRTKINARLCAKKFSGKIIDLDFEELPQKKD